MIYKFVLVSNEVDDFMREISIDSEAKFIDLHNAILDSVKYTKDGITTFFLCNDDWEKEQEVSLFEMETSMDVDSYTMDGTVLSEGDTYKGDRRVTFIGGDGITFDDGNTVPFGQNK